MIIREMVGGIDGVSALDLLECESRRAECLQWVESGP